MGDPEIQKAVIRHAQKDMAANPLASHRREGDSLLKRAMATRDRWAAEQPSFGGQLAAMWREGIKDIRQTMNETFFGKAEHMPEAGTPMNPTQQQVTVEQGNFHGYDYNAQLDIAAARGTAQDDGLTR